MMYQRLVAGLGGVLTMVLAMSCGAAGGQRLDDPANLAGERVKAAAGEATIQINTGAAALRQSLMKLRTRASLMMIVAHPDDEDGGMLTYESRGKGARVAMLTLTRGEGGQNQMSGDFDDALGLIRTQELLAADRYMDVDQMFGTEVDFGFSKTKEESFSQWTHERVLYDAVRAVRLYRPLVLTSVFIGGPTDGHGHHQVSGEMAQEVFAAAADPKVFPEMGLEPWTPLKVYARVPFAYVTVQGIYDYATNKFAPMRFYNYVTKTWSNEIPKANVIVHEGNLSDLLGMSYAQFAREGLGLQKTQIGNNTYMVPTIGAFDVGYHRYGSRVKTAEMEQSFFDGVDVSLEGIATLAPSDNGSLRAALEIIDGHAATATAAFSVHEPERCAPELRDGLKALDQVIAAVEGGALPAREKNDVLHELRVKRVQFNDALVEALGLRVEARMETGRPGECSTARAPGCMAHVTTKVINEGKTTVEVTATFVSATGVSAGPEKRWGAGSAKLEPGRSLDSFFERNTDVRRGEKQDHVTGPYFTRESTGHAYYDVSDPALRLAPQTPPESFWVRASYDGVPLLQGQVVLAPKSGAGEVDRPLEVVPPLSVSISPAVGIIPLSAPSFPVSVQVRSDEQKGVAGRVRLQLPEGWRSEPRNAEFAFHHAEETQRFSFRVTPHKLTQQSYTLNAVAETAKGTTREGYRAVGYQGLIPTNMYSSATYKVRGVDVKITPGLKVGYLPGTGDEVKASLEDLGVHATTLTMEDVREDRLGGYDVVVLGVRAYAAHPEMAAANGKLLTYAKNGGVLIVQYNRGWFDYGPYPYSLGSEENVVDEAAPVKLLMPDSPLLSWPNRISEKDFDGWVEERGHSFMEGWNSHYEALLETHDPGQDPQKGGLLVTKTGKGAYVYVAFALYRQLPEGVPGAYRLFANLLSLGKAPVGPSQNSDDKAR